jgi:branched-subunit amino acid ABC-type transport system permease component
MSKFFVYIIVGLGPGAAYALISQGVVATYMGSGVINFAQGGLAMMSAYLWLILSDNNVLAPVPAMLLVVAGAGVTGVLLYLKVIRNLRSAPMLARVTATVGILLALDGAAQLIFSTNVYKVPSIVPNQSLQLFGAKIGTSNIWLAGIAIVVAIGLSILYRRTTFGLATRGAAECEKGATLLGFSPDFLGAANWGIGVALAALAGILVAPLLQVSVDTFILLVVPALAAALLARFSSILWATFAGLALGIVEAEIAAYWNHPGISDSLPLVVIVVAMVVTGNLIPSRGFLSLSRPPLATEARFSPIWLGLLGVGTVLILTVTDRIYISALSTTFIMAIIAISVVVVTGYTGQISLAQMTFAGISALMVSKLGTNLGIPFPWSIILAMLCAVPVGIIIGLPALRIRGINLAVVTLSAAVAVDSLIFNDAGITGGFTGSPVPSPSIFGFSLDPTAHPTRFAIFSLVMFLIVAYLAGSLRRSPTGRRMLAVRDNERAAAVMGVNVTATKLAAFAISAGIAGLGGALLATQQTNVSFDQFNYMASLLLVVFVYVGGIGSLGGAVFTGITTAGGLLATWFTLQIPAFNNYNVLIGGLAAISVAMNAPDGVVPTVAAELRALRARRRRPGRIPAPAEAPPAAAAAAASPSRTSR